MSPVKMMTGLHSDAEAIAQHLARLAEEIDGCSAEINRIEEQHLTCEDGIRGNVREALVAFEEHVTFVESCIKIAAAHAERNLLQDALEPRPFDKSALLRLQVLIDNRSDNDPMAAKLYWEATAQRLYLESERSRMKSRLVEEGAEKLRSLERGRVACLERQESLIDAYCRELRGPQFRDLAQASERLMEGSSVSESVGARVGFELVKVCVPCIDDEAIEHALRSAHGVVSVGNSYFIQVPIVCDTAAGGSLLVQAVNQPGRMVRSGIEQFVLDAMVQGASTFDRIECMDPVNLSLSSFPALSRLAALGGTFVRPAPASSKEISERLRALDEQFLRVERTSEAGVSSRNTATAILLLYHFPEEYSAQDVAIVRRLANNAERYGLLVVMLGRTPQRWHMGEDGVLGDIARSSLVVRENEDGWSVSEFDKDDLARRFDFAPHDGNLPHSLIEAAKRGNGAEAEDNGYVTYLAGRTHSNRIVKGDRFLQDIPIGVDEDGHYVFASFEDERFATFVCGAARSGKSTLLHTILTGVFLSKHPDDVEVWLVDFKMTEFSRYIETTPPHVKYIVLDESPELVYDLIDRLVDYLSWRQKKFKNNHWEKIDDAQRAGAYMPTVLVVIDEFSVMSKIIDDAFLAGKDYRDKMQLLLAKGAALGFRFIFASQGFTKGTKGLSPYSKDQIQQRIAMKTTYEEIKATLDLPSISDSDRMEMEELDRHYALMKMPIGFDGGTSRIQKSHVLYFQDRSEQLDILSREFARYRPDSTFDRNDADAYVKRKAIILDGNERQEFDTAWDMIEHHQRTWRSFDDTAILACIGEPRRLTQYCPIELVDNYGENILLLGSLSDGESVRSIVASVVKSLSSQQVRVHLCLSKQNKYLRDIADSMGSASVCRSSSEVGALVGGMCDAIARGEDGRDFVVFFDIEGIVEDCEHRMASPSNVGAATQRTRAPGEPDLRQKLALLREGDTSILESMTISVSDGNDSEAASEPDRDLRDDVRQLISLGARSGFHVMLVAENNYALEMARADNSKFKHRVFFNSQRELASSFVSKSDREALAEAGSSCYRYVSAAGGVTFRPYEHADLGIYASQADDDDFYYFDWD